MRVSGHNVPTRPTVARGPWRAALAFLACVTAPACFLDPIRPEDLVTARSAMTDAAAERWSTGGPRTPLLAREISLVDAVKVALVNNKDLRSVIDEREVARGGAVGSFSELLPSVDASLGYLGTEYDWLVMIYLLFAKEEALPLLLVWHGCVHCVSKHKKKKNVTKRDSLLPVVHHE